MKFSELKDVSDFYLKLSLYEDFSWEEKEVFQVAKLLYYNGTIDCHCVQCRKSSTFSTQNSVPDLLDKNLWEYRYKSHRSGGGTFALPKFDNRIHHLEFSCSRNGSHQILYLFLPISKAVESENGYVTKQVIQKIGQHPSYSDLSVPHVKEYPTKVLSSDNRRELVRAINLASSDIGIGSYVYLRRVFESLVENSHQGQMKIDGWDEEKYKDEDMKGKIKMLKDNLPEFLVNHPEMYALLSKGIHELSEQECKKHFETLRLAIELILDELVEQREKAAKTKRAKALLSNAVSSVTQ